MAKADDRVPPSIPTMPTPGRLRSNYCLQCGDYISSFEARQPIIDDLDDYSEILKINRGGLPRALHGSIRRFSIERRNYRPEGRPVVFINGFLQEGVSDVRDWTSPLAKYFRDSSWYHLDWESKRLTGLGGWLQESVVTPLATSAKNVGPIPGVGGPLAAVLVAKGIVRNPWHNAMAKAEITGVVLADLIMQTKQSDFVLMGHSLGARVIHSTLVALALRRSQKIADVFLLGGAVGKDPISDWEFAARAVRGTIHNFRSRNDKILERLYENFNARLSQPIGLYPIASENSKILDHDFTQPVGGHFKWKHALPQVFEHVAKHGRGL